MADCEHTYYIAFVDDPTQELKSYEFIVETSSAEDAYIAAQEAFPYGIIRVVVSSAELDEGEQMKARAARKRAEEDKRLK